MAYAHTPGEAGDWDPLERHLRDTAALAREFAGDFGAEQAGYYAGLWHDLGKFHPKFQEYLQACARDPAARGHGPDHKGVGALLATRHLAPLAMLIQGHHGGLRSRGDVLGWLSERGADPAVQAALERAREALPELEPSGRIPFPAYVERDPLGQELFLRMLFSTLVDADFLDTERHFQPDAAALRGAEVDFTELWGCFERDQAGRFADAPDSVVNRVRAEVYAACLQAAEAPPGLFRLTVPTGGGKTRSALAFALRHALRHRLRRVIVAVPYLSITEQTAAVYRAIFETTATAPVVLEHHSGMLEPGQDEEDFHASRSWARLAAENWDAPIVVTTMVQLFESLFGRATSRCRKLHRLSRAVIVLDEVQALPPGLLEPILDGLRQLCAHYGTTVLLTTATQPAFEAIPAFSTLPAREIVPQPGHLFRDLVRVDYAWRTERPLDWPEVAEELRGSDQALAVLNTKRDALALLEALADPDALHLSTLLCGAHRRAVIAETRRRLAAGEGCRVVSTQVVEAGVDLDFPLVLRALGPLDGIIQAAGRCNREGRLARGRVIVFEPAAGGLPPGTYKVAAGITRTLLATAGFDPDSVETPWAYFRELFRMVSTDREQIQALRASFDYPEVARRFRLIEDDSESVIITRYGSPEERERVQELLEQLRRHSAPPRFLLRQLQPYLVSIRTRLAERYRRERLIRPIVDGLGEWLGGYDAVRGLVAGDLSPDELVV